MDNFDLTKFDSMNDVHRKPVFLMCGILRRPCFTITWPMYTFHFTNKWNFVMKNIMDTVEY